MTTRQHPTRRESASAAKTRQKKRRKWLRGLPSFKRGSLLDLAIREREQKRIVSGGLVGREPLGSESVPHTGTHAERKRRRKAARKARARNRGR